MGRGIILPSSFDFNIDGRDEAELRSGVLENTKESSLYYTRKGIGNT